MESSDSPLRPSSEHPVKQWLLLTGGRLTVTAVLLVAVFLLLVGLSQLRPWDMYRLLDETDAVSTLFSVLLSGAILLVSIVVSINSIVLSEEITDIDAQQERISASIEYRRHIEDFIEVDVTPAQPSEFLTAVLYAISSYTRSLQQIVEENDNEAFQQHVHEFAEEVGEDVDHARSTLENAELGTVKVLLAGLDYDYSGQLHAARGFKRTYADDLTDEEEEAIDTLIETLKFFATGREYFKSLYYKRELARLSSRLLYVSLPVIVFTSYVLLAIHSTVIPDVTVTGVSSLLWFLMFAYTVALAPYVVLTAYTVRAATITLRTLAAGPFLLQNRNDIDPLEWEDLDNEYDWKLPEAAADE